jgi:GTPase SAR1 family protein
MVLVVFVGPQASGKTTMAKLLIKRLLSRGLKICNAKLIDYTIFHHRFLKILRLIVKDVDASKVFVRLFPLYVLAHFVGVLISEVKVVSLRLAKKCHIIVEDEGFIFKEIADLYFIASSTGALNERLNRYIMKAFMKFLLLQARTLIGSLIVFNVNSTYNALVIRYKLRGKIEPKRYIDFQVLLYRIMAHYIDTSYGDAWSWFSINMQDTDWTSISSYINYIVEILSGVR